MKLAGDLQIILPWTHCVVLCCVVLCCVVLCCVVLCCVVLCCVVLCCVVLAKIGTLFRDYMNI
jgi:hypothetical protein